MARLVLVIVQLVVVAEVCAFNDVVACYGDIDTGGGGNVAFDEDISAVRFERVADELARAIDRGSVPESITGSQGTIPLDAAFVRVGLLKAVPQSVDTSFKVSGLAGTP